MIHFIQTHAAGGDACAPYDVKFDRPYTIGELVNEVLNNRRNEWGEFRVRYEGDKWLDSFFNVEYKYGKLIGKIPENIANMPIEKTHSYGGWSSMTYYIIVKKDIPKIISKGKITLDENTEITVCVLDNGQRIIPEEDMLKALKFLGLSEADIKNVLHTQANKER